MSRRRGFVATTAVVLLLAVLAGCGSQAPAKRATMLPDVVLPALGAGEATDLGALRGPALINVWASYCQPCKRELPLYAEFAADNPDVAVIGIDYKDGDPDAARRMLKAAGADYLNLVDFDGALPVIALPQVIVLDAEGRIVYRESREIMAVSDLEQLVDQELGDSR